MMLLDGCFLLQFIRSQDDGSTDDGGTNDDGADDGGTDDMSNVLRDHQISFVEQDLFLLENQLPFGVLKLIFEGFNDDLTMEKMIKKFVTDKEELEESTSEIHLEEASHLLGILRSALLGQSQPKPSPSQGICGRFCGPCQKGKQQRIRQSFRNIKELKAAGIHLQPSETNFLRDVSFNSDFFYGCLKLPPIIIDDSTKAKFLNIVAYEMCPGAPYDYAVTSYVCFLYELIDHADDVKELRSKHILSNCLGSDEDVARIFNEIGNDVIFTDAYKDVKDRIQEHYNKRMNTWIAQALHDHFSTPWTIIAFIAAVLILFLTGVQTYYAIPGN